jgi:hypothetical protein
MPNQHSKKHHHAGTTNIAPDPLVDPGNPSHRYQARSTAHLDRPCSRMVALAASSSGRSAPRWPQKKNATVMLMQILVTGVAEQVGARIHAQPGRSAIMPHPGGDFRQSGRPTQQPRAKAGKVKAIDNSSGVRSVCRS